MADLAPAAGVDGLELGGYDGWIWWGGGGVRFVGEEFGDEVVLDFGDVAVAYDAGEGEVGEPHGGRGALSCCGGSFVRVFDDV